MIRLLSSFELLTVVHRCTWYNAFVARPTLEWPDNVTRFKTYSVWACIRNLTRDVFETTGTQRLVACVPLRPDAN
jgi:hypothetical protein